MELPDAISTRRRYPVFISYSHRDERWARWLHKAIEAYRVPKPLVGRQAPDGPIPAKIFPVFRDRDELASSPDLSRELRAALAQSANLIVLCSPAAARSRYVNQEIIEFKRLGRADRVLPLIVGGEPFAKAPEDECFPPALRFEVDAHGNLTDRPAEPIGADLRAEADGRENAKLKLIAGVLGVPFNDLRQRELIAARRRARVWQGIGAAMLVLAVLATIGGVMAWRYARHAEDLLAEGIRISADQVGAAVHVADQQGVGRNLIGELLNQSESAFGGLYRKAGEAPGLPWRDAVIPAALRGQYAVLRLVFADHYGIIGKIDQQRLTANKARAELGSVRAEQPANPEWGLQLARSHDLVADAYATEWQVERALNAYRTALVIREHLVAGDSGNTHLRREIGLSHINIGDMLRRQGLLVPSLDAYRTALALGQNLAAAEPSNPVLVRDLLIVNHRIGDMLLKQGAHVEAEASYRAAFASAEHLAAAEPGNVQARRDLAVSLDKLGTALRRQEKDEAALVAYESSLAIVRSLAAADPANVGLQRDLFKSHEAIGIARLTQGDLRSAAEAFLDAIAIAEGLAADDPNNGLLRRELTVLQNRLGDVHYEQGQLAAALALYQEARDARRTLAADLTNAQAQRDLSLSHEKIADVLRRQGRWQEAGTEYEEALSIAQRLADKEPTNRQWHRELAIAHHNLARALEGQGRSAEALQAYEAALATIEQLAQGPSDGGTLKDLLVRYSNLAEFHERKGNRAEARRNYCQAKTAILSLMKLKPENGEWRERDVWIEERLEATHDPTSAQC
jgi:eukaryotic-like serine/threonine-protein kinase